MDAKQSYDGFFVDDEISFKKEQVLELINRCKEFAQLVGKSGSVNIIAKNLSIIDRAKLFLVTRYLGAELGKLDPSLSLPDDLGVVHGRDLARFLDVSEPNARTRMSTLNAEGFAKKPKKGHIEVLPHCIKGFLDLLSDPKKTSTTKKSSAKTKGIRKQKRTPSSLPMTTINVDQVYERLSINLEIAEEKAKNCVLINEDGSFKFNNAFAGNSKMAKQTDCILCSAFVITVGMAQSKFSSRTLKEVCYHSNIDVSGLNYTVREIKKKGYITKAARNSHENLIMKKGKQEAKKILANLCNNE